MNRKTIVIFLLLIFLLQAMPLIRFVANDSANAAYDESWHAMISLNYYNQLFHKTSLTTDQIEKIYPTFKHANDYYPPLFHISALPFYLLFGTNFSIALLSNLLFLIILIINSFFIGKKLFGPKAGLILSFIVSTIPTYSNLLTEYLIDFSFVSMVVLGIALLLYSDHFTNTRFSILFGIVFGLGMLTKWTYVLFFIIPVLYELFIFFSLKIKIRKLKNIIIPFLISLIIMSTWYTYSKISYLIPALKFYSDVGVEPGSVFAYLFIINSGFSFFYLILFIAGVFSIFKAQKMVTYCISA